MTNDPLTLMTSLRIDDEMTADSSFVIAAAQRRGH
jgi:hypothetical protein